MHSSVPTRPVVISSYYVACKCYECLNVLKSKLRVRLVSVVQQDATIQYYATDVSSLNPVLIQSSFRKKTLRLHAFPVVFQ
jgi:vacuolar-type H+-ATPase catalytic subunit A/Vma1